jgi:uncharacterized protein YjbI with pentapeptide repeats
MLGANLELAIMHGATFERTKLQGTTFYRVQLQGALFQDAMFEGTLFVEAQLQGAQMKARSSRASALRDSIVSDSFLWRSRGDQCESTHVASPNFEAIIEVKDASGNPVRIAATEQEISDFITRSLEDVPDKPNAAAKFSKARLRADLTSRLGMPASAASAPIEQAWRNCARESEARTPEGFQKLAANIVKYACHSFIDLDRFAKAFATGASKDSGNRWALELRQIPVGRLFAKSILEADEQECPSAKKLTEATREQLRYVINPGE